MPYHELAFPAENVLEALTAAPGDYEQSMAEATRMTQTQIIRELAEEAQVPTKIAKQLVTKFAEMAVRETKKKGVFVLPGIGRLVRVERKARTGRNPATGEAIKIPAKKVVKFRIAKSVKDAIVPPKAAKGTSKQS